MENTSIEHPKLLASLKNWQNGSDGQEGATMAILGCIPYSLEMDKILPWDEVDKDFDDAIGYRPSDNEVDIEKWAEETAKRIEVVYDSVVKRIHNIMKGRE